MYIPGAGRGIPTRRPDQVGGNTPLPTAQKPNVAKPGGGFMSSFRSGVGNMVPQGMDHQALGLGLIQFGKNFADGTATGEYDFSPAFETFAKSSIANQNKRGPLESVKALYESGKIPQSDYMAAQRDKSGAVAALILKRVYGTSKANESFRTITGPEAAKMGLDPAKAYNVSSTGKISQIGGQGATVNVDNKGESEFAKIMGKNTANMFDNAVKAGRAAQSLNHDMEILAALADAMGPDGTGGIPGHLKNIFPQATSASAAYASIINKLAPQMRAEGSGSTSDKEMEGYFRSLPSLKNNPLGNKIITRVIQKKAQIDLARQKVAMDLMAGRLKKDEAIDKMMELDALSIRDPELDALIAQTNPDLSDEDLVDLYKKKK